MNSHVLTVSIFNFGVIIKGHDQVSLQILNLKIYSNKSFKLLKCCYDKSKPWQNASLASGSCPPSLNNKIFCSKTFEKAFE